MTWAELEKSILCAWALAFTKAKLILCFISLSLCGLLTVFCRVLATGTNPWIHLLLAFTPIFVSLGLLLSTGVILTRMYLREMRGLTVDLKKLLATSYEVILGTSYLSFPPLFAFICLWIALGVFVLLKEIPVVGTLISIPLAFVPFLLVLCSLLLCLGEVFLLFFIVPAIAHHSAKKVQFWREVWQVSKQRPLPAVLLFFLGLLPAGLVGGLLTIAATMTQANFSLHKSAISIALEGFFMMLPYCALLTPPVIFFFHFAAESYRMLRR